MTLATLSCVFRALLVGIKVWLDMRNVMSALPAGSTGMLAHQISQLVQSVRLESILAIPVLAPVLSVAWVISNRMKVQASVTVVVVTNK